MSDNNLEDEFTEDEYTYTVTLDGKEYGLTEEFRNAIQRRAKGEYEGNDMFSCWWQVKDGNPVLSIETSGPIVPWERLDELEMGMVEEHPGSDSDKSDPDEVDEGNGMKTIDPSDVKSDDDDTEPTVGRTYFPMTPQQFEEVPQPDGEGMDKLPPKPMEMGDEPSLIWWVPSDESREERWSTGEAIIPVDSWVNWDVQKRAEEGDAGHWESILKMYDCPVVGTVQPKQKPPKKSGQDKRKGDGWYDNKDAKDGQVGARWSI